MVCAFQKPNGCFRSTNILTGVWGFESTKVLIGVSRVVLSQKMFSIDVSCVSCSTPKVDGNVFMCKQVGANLVAWRETTWEVVGRVVVGNDKDRRCWQVAPQVCGGRDMGARGLVWFEVSV